MLPPRCLVRTRENGKRNLILSLLGVSMFSGMQKGVHKNGLLFTEKAFAWSVVDYTNYRSFECTIYALRYTNKKFLWCFLKCNSKSKAYQYHWLKYFQNLHNNTHFVSCITHAWLHVSNCWRIIHCCRWCYDSKFNPFWLI